jgi:hypothetical protein
LSIKSRGGTIAHSSQGWLSMNTIHSWYVEIFLLFLSILMHLHRPMILAIGLTLNLSGTFYLRRHKPWPWGLLILDLRI